MSQVTSTVKKYLKGADWVHFTDVNDAFETFERLTAAFADFAVPTNDGRFAAEHDVRRPLQGVQKRLATTEKQNV